MTKMKTMSIEKLRYKFTPAIKITRDIKKARANSTISKNNSFLQRQYKKKRTLYKVVKRISQWMDKIANWKYGRDNFKTLLKHLDESGSDYYKFDFYGQFDYAHVHKDFLNYRVSESARKYIMDEKLQKKLEFSIEVMTGRELIEWIVENENPNFKDKKIPWELEKNLDEKSYYIIRKHW